MRSNNALNSLNYRAFVLKSDVKMVSDIIVRFSKDQFAKWSFSWVYFNTHFQFIFLYSMNLLDISFNIFFDFHTHTNIH